MGSTLPRTSYDILRVEIDRYLMFYTRSTAKGHIRAKQNEFPPQVKILIHYSIRFPVLRTEEKMKLNESGKAETR